MNDLRLSIHQTYAAIGIDSENGSLHVRSQPGTQTIQSPSAAMNFTSKPSNLEIDSSKAWHALGKGPNLEWSSAIYSQMRQIFLQHLAAQVDEGKRMMNITNGRSAFADLAKDVLFRPNPVNYQTEMPDYHNVRLAYSIGGVNTTMEPTAVAIQYEAHKPEIDYLPGKLDIYLRQKNTLSIEVTTYDLYK
jgi:hypothetical protein